MSAEAPTPALSDVEARTGVALEIVRGVLGDIPPAELAGKSLDHLAWVVEGQVQAAQRRTGAHSIVEVEGDLPASLIDDAVEHGGVNRLTAGAVIRVVTDDMPFVVDSIVAAVTSRGAGIGDLLHPQMAVRRDASGQLCFARRSGKRPGAVRLPGQTDTVPEGQRESEESWVYLHISPLGDFTGADEIERTISDVIDDVRAASNDWQRMRDQALAIVDDLGDNPPVSVPEFATADVRRFLTWLSEGNFTFLGYREYALDVVDGEDVLRPVDGSALGILRSASDAPRGFERMTPQSRAAARSPQLLTLTKANSRSRVHRDAYLDYVGVKTFDDAGNVTGERRFLGLHTARTYAASPSSIPVVAERVAKVIRRAGYSPDSHSGRDLLHVLESYPRDELFQTSSERLYEIATEVVRLQARRHVGVFLRNDDYGRFVAVLVYLPRDRYNTRVREAIAQHLAQAYGAETVDYTARVTSEALARIYYTVRLPRGTAIPDVSADDIRAAVLEVTRTWSERVTQAAHAEEGLADVDARQLVSTFADGFPAGYSDDFTPRQAVADMRRLERLGDDDAALTLYGTDKVDSRERRLKIFRNEPLMLTEVFPIFTNLGVQVSDERPYTLTRADGSTCHVYDFGLVADRTAMWGNTPQESARRRTNVMETVLAAWRGQAENDALNQLVLAAGLSWRQINHLRALARYMRQIGFSLSYEYVVAALLANTDLTSLLVRLFEARFDPSLDADEREAQTQAVRQRFADGLADVASLDHDRILRTLEGVIMAIVRTNAYTPKLLSGECAELVFKIRCADVPGIPAPVPMFEIWVYGPKVEGVHLRFGLVARGGLRWSDRFEDFRTEILGLVKAQMVKNAVIVPTGSKGGFVAKQLPDPADREAWLAAGVETYEAFIGGLLSVTDNRDGDTIIAPPPAIGGHVTHHAGGSAGMYRLRTVSAPVRPDGYTVDLDALRALAHEVRPRLITIGASLNLYPHPVAAIREIADEVGAYLLFDAAHLCGLIAGRAWPNPLEQGAHLMTFSTYKSLGGPAGGAVVTDDAELAQRIDAIAFPGLTANFDAAKSAALAVTMVDWQVAGAGYAAAMVATARALAEALQARGLPVFTGHDGPTRSHQFALRARPWGGGQAAARRLRRANLLACGIGLPEEPIEGDVNGLRIGTPELVRLGLRVDDMPGLADLIARGLDESVAPETVAPDVTAFRARFHGIHYTADSPEHP